MQQVNASAREIMVGILQSLVALGKAFKELIEDRNQKRGELIVNWRELDAEMGHGVREAMAVSYTRLSRLVQLIQVLVKP